MTQNQTTAMTAGRNFQMQKKLWEEAVRYVQQYRGAVLKRAKQFIHYTSGLSLEDFNQESFLIAFQARKKVYEEFCRNCRHFKDGRCSLEHCEPFIAFFWGMLRARFAEFADIPSEYKIAKNKSSASKAPFQRFEAAELLNEENFKNSVVLADLRSAETKLIEACERKEIMKRKQERSEKILRSLTEKEKKLFFLIEQGKTINEITKKLNYRRDKGVRMLIKRTVEKVERLCAHA